MDLTLVYDDGMFRFIINLLNWTKNNREKPFNYINLREDNYDSRKYVFNNYPLSKASKQSGFYNIKDV